MTIRETIDNVLYAMMQLAAFCFLLLVIVASLALTAAIVRIVFWSNP